MLQGIAEVPLHGSPLRLRCTEWPYVFKPLDLYPRLRDAGVTDVLCVLWMGMQATERAPGVDPDRLFDLRELFAEHVIAKMD